MSCDKHSKQSYMLGLVCKPEILNLRPLNLKPQTKNLQPELETQNLKP